MQVSYFMDLLFIVFSKYCSLTQQNIFLPFPLQAFQQSNFLLKSKLSPGSQNLFRFSAAISPYSFCFSKRQHSPHYDPCPCNIAVIVYYPALGTRGKFLEYFAATVVTLFFTHIHVIRNFVRIYPFSTHKYYIRAPLFMIDNVDMQLCVFEVNRTLIYSRGMQLIYCFSIT